MATYTLPIQIPLVDGRGMIDRHWARLLSELQAQQPLGGSGFVTDGSKTSFAPMTLFQGNDAGKPGIAIEGAFYFAVDTNKIYRAVSGTWKLFSDELVGDVTKPVGSQVTTLSTVFFSPGTYGSGSQAPVLTIDGKGRVTDLWFEPIVAAPAVPGGVSTSLQFNNSGTLDGALIFYDAITGGLTFSHPEPTREALSPLTTKGDIFVRNSTISTRLPVGTDGQYLRADSSTPEGLRWVDDNTVEVRFNFGDATPKPIVTVPAFRVVLETKIVILEPFDDLTSTLELGPGSLIEVTDNIPTQIGTYNTEPGIEYPINTAIELTINPGVSSQGYGLVTITLEE